MRNALMAAGAVLTCLGGATAVAAAPLETYGRLPSLEQMVVSPDGSKMAYITDVEGKRSVVVQAIRPTKLIMGVQAGSQKLRGLVWAGSDHVLITTSTTGRPLDVVSSVAEWSITQSLDLNSHTFKVVLQGANQDSMMNVTAGAPRVRLVNGHPTVFLGGYYFDDGEGRLGVFQADLVTGKVYRVEGTQRDVQDWVIDEQGQLVAEADYSTAKQHWTLRVKQGGRWRDALSVDAAIDTPDVLGVTPDGKAILVRQIVDGKTKDALVSLDEGAQAAGLDGSSKFDTTVHDPATHRIIGGEVGDMKTDYVFFDPKDQADWQATQRAFPGENVELESWTDDRKLVIVKVTGPTHGVVYVAVDHKAHAADVVGQVYQGIGPEDVAEVRDITYKAADGREIPAYLTLPKGREAKNLPLVVLPHGGPAARDDPGFDWWSQALASRGYAVLQPQFRGSDGFGWEHLAAGFGQWGRKMQTDLSDGVRDLAAKGLIDPKRVCIVGASYGGYAALAGATLDPDVYRCAVSDAGIADLHQFVLWRASQSEGDKGFQSRYWDRFMGAKNPNDPALDAISPIKHIDKVKVPILLIHGRDDTVVPFEQSQMMADALKRAGKPVELVALPSEDHWLSRSQTRLQMLQAIVKFLEANNPPG
jgi:dipeptidyl aminopeptidase/acylaminoacyl peptidase